VLEQDFVSYNLENYTKFPYRKCYNSFKCPYLFVDKNCHSHSRKTRWKQRQHRLKAIMWYWWTDLHDGNKYNYTKIYL